MEVPVALHVWDFALPTTPTLATAFGSPAGRLRGYYRKRAKQGKEAEPADWDAVETPVRRTADRASHQRHAAAGRLAPAAQPDGSFPHSRGADRTRCASSSTAITSTPIQIAHPRSAVKDPEAERDRLHAWLRRVGSGGSELDRPPVRSTPT